MDVFSIKSLDAAFKIGDKQYVFVDPPFLTKIVVRQKYLDLRKAFDKEAFDVVEYSKKMFEINKDQIKMYLPDIEIEVLDKLGDSNTNALLRKLTDLAENSLGAVVEQVSEK